MYQAAIDVRTRPVSPHDAALAARWMIDEWSVPASIADRAEDIFRSMIAEERIRGGCIEVLTRDSAWTIAAIGLSAFIDDAEVQRYLAAPTPFPSLALLARAIDGEGGVFLDIGRVARLNANGGLNQITVYYGQTHKDPSDPRCREILPASHKLHREVHGGYRIKRLMQDEWSDFEAVFTSAGYRILGRFPSGSICPEVNMTLDRSRTLVSLTDQDARTGLPGSTASFLFEYRAPRLDLTAAERRLLAHAASGLTDKDICEAFGLSPNTLKGSWRQIYEKFDEKASHVLISERGESDGHKRGAEKRRRVIAFINDHLEELRPFAHR